MVEGRELPADDATVRPAARASFGDGALAGGHQVGQKGGRDEVGDDYVAMLGEVLLEV